jgi:hypothetical protein
MGTNFIKDENGNMKLEEEDVRSVEKDIFKYY